MRGPGKYILYAYYNDCGGRRGILYRGYIGSYIGTYRSWPRPLWNCFQNDTVRMGTPAPGQARRQHTGEFDDAAQLPVVFHRFRAVCRMRSPTQVSANLNLPTVARVIYCTIIYIIINYIHTYIYIILHNLFNISLSLEYSWWFLDFRSEILENTIVHQAEYNVLVG